MIELKGKNGAVSEAEVRDSYRTLTLRLIETNTTITTMESCTSGQVASLITDTEGSSAVLKGAFITYSNTAKILQGVSGDVIEAYGVYSAETAEAMAKSCRKTYQADIGIGVTGSFGNADPNNSDSVPGEVYFAIDSEEGITCYHCTVPVQPSRYAYKLYMADLIVNEVLKLNRLSVRA